MTINVQKIKYTVWLTQNLKHSCLPDKGSFYGFCLSLAFRMALVRFV